MADDWGWWAGSDKSLFSVGPFPTKDDAIQEALGQGSFEEVETDAGWKRLVFFAECRGLYYDCEECGSLPEPCAECRDILLPEDLRSTFAQARNAGSVVMDYDDDQGE